MKRQAFTFIEIVMGFLIMTMLLLAVYRLFFAEIRNIRQTLEHISVNESARLFLVQFGDDVRNANWLEFPPATVREGVPRLLPALVGKVCAFTTQVFDFSVKPPDPRFIGEIKIEWHLKKDSDGNLELHREVNSDVPAFPGGPSPYKATRKICGGIKEIFVFSSMRRSAKLSAFSGLPFKNLLSYEPYDVDGTGPQLVHVRVTFIRETSKGKTYQNENPLTIKTCFAIRGKLNTVNP